jgi:cytochrome c-type biogenesis protein CcmF
MIGSFCLTLALIAALAQSVLPYFGYYRHNAYLLAVARPAAYLQAIAVIAAYLCLSTAFLTNDFSLIYVANNSHPTLPWFYRLAAVWGGHEGSLLLWVLCLNAWTLFYTYAQKNTAQRQLTLATLGGLSTVFIMLILFTANPFLTANLPLHAADLNPLLQDSGDFIHPPLLTLGYVGFSLTFAFTFAALLTNTLNRTYAAQARTYALLAWCVLTLGIVLGSWWAYRVLGWGGFWFWDPVENAALLPWLTGLAFIHCALLMERKNIAVGFTTLLALLSFCLSLLGTFLVRSGLLISSHTFASDPTHGLCLLVFLGVVLFAALIVLIYKCPASPPWHILLGSRESILFMNAGLLLIIMLTILLGTLYPLVLDALGLGKIAVGAPYFNSVLWPLVCLALFFMAIGPLCPRDAVLSRFAIKPLMITLILSFITSFVFLIITPSFTLNTFLLLSLSLWVLMQCVKTWRHLPAMTIAHLGFVILLLGVVLSSTFTTTQETTLKPGEAMHLGPYQVFFLELREIKTPHSHRIIGVFDVVKNGHTIALLTPEKRIYPVRQMITTQAAIDPGVFRDLYLVLGDPQDDDHWAVKLTYKPFIRWIGIGGAFMIFGGILAIIQRRLNRTQHDDQL